MLSHFVCFFALWANLVLTKFVQHFTLLYLGQMWDIEAMQVTPGGPDTQDDPYQRGAVREA